jgi:hypothetical protein
MVSQLTSRLPHKIDEDGSVDSICIACYAKVGSGLSGAELASCENRHVCDPISLYCASQARHVPARSLFDVSVERR